MKFFVTFAVLLILAASALADEKKPDCAAALREYIYGPWAIAKGMADYRAAMDAGYETCSGKDPEPFEAVADTYEFLKDNTEKEMEQAAAVLDYLIAHPDPKKVPEACLGDSAAQEALKKEVMAAVEGQYSKAYERRARALAAAEPAAGDKDSCGLVLEMVQKYGAHYEKYDQLQHVLYESSKKQGRIVLTGSDRKASFRNFEKTREKLSVTAPVEP